MSKPYRITFYDDPPSVYDAEEIPEADAQITEVNPAVNNAPTAGVATKEDIERIIETKLSGLKVYVVESDITQAQNAVKSVVELASY